MPKKRTKKTVTRSLDSLCSKIVRNLNKNQCAKCNKPASEVHHLFGRAKRSVRWDLDNLLPLCSGCHIFSQDSFEKSPYHPDNEKVINEWLTPEDFEDLKRRAMSLKKWTLSEMLELEKELKEILNF